jgi:hypothetical protein
MRCSTFSEKQRIIAMVCSQAPEGRARWTVRLVVEEAVKRKPVPKVGRETIRILLQSHEWQPVVCLDEKPISLHDDVRPPIPAQPGKPAKQDNENDRCGMAKVFGVGEPKTGRHIHYRHTQPFWRRVRAYSRARREAVPGGQHDSPGYGQPQHTHP